MKPQDPTNQEPGRICDTTRWNHNSTRLHDIIDDSPMKPQNTTNQEPGRICDTTRQNHNSTRLYDIIDDNPMKAQDPTNQEPGRLCNTIVQWNYKMLYNIIVQWNHKITRTNNLEESATLQDETTRVSDSMTS